MGNGISFWENIACWDRKTSCRKGFFPVKIETDVGSYVFDEVFISQITILFLLFSTN